MKIVDICEFYSERGGGVRSYVNKKLELAAVHDHDLTIVAPGRGDRIERRSRGKIVWLKSPALPFDRNYGMFWRAKPVWDLLDAENPDIVEGSSPWRGGWLAAHWRGNSVKSFMPHQDFVATYGHTFLGSLMSADSIDRLFRWYWRYLQRLSARFDATIVANSLLAQRLTKFGVHRPIAIPFGVERGRFSNTKRDEALRQDLLGQCSVSAEGKLLLVVSRLHPEKRVRTLIDGFAIAKKQRPLGLVIVGHGLQRSSLAQRARAVGNIVMADELRDRDLIARYYASADLFLHGCAAETYGLAVAEALASGLSVVVPDAGGAAALAMPARSQLYRRFLRLCRSDS
jgi:alpha-1,6-mannosyltransferase